MPTVVATDDFNRADGPIGLNWNSLGGETFNVVSNAATPANDGINSIAWWIANSFEDDQYSEATIISDNLGFKGVIVRADTSGGDNAYLVITFHASTIRIYKVVSSTYTELQDTGITPIAGDRLRIEVTGQAPNIELKAYLNDVQIGTTITGLSDHNSGAAGIFGQDPGGLTPRVDDWEGGNMADAVTGKPFIMQLGAKRIN